MKRLIQVFLFLSVPFTALTQDTSNRYEIIGYIKGIGTNNKVYIGNKGEGYNSATKLIFYDSCLSRNDSFYFTGNISQPNIYSIEIPQVKRGWLYFILEASNIYITDTSGKLYTAKIIGSTQDSIYRKYINDLKKPNSAIIRFWRDKRNSEPSTSSHSYYIIIVRLKFHIKIDILFTSKAYRAKIGHSKIRGSTPY